VKAQYSSFDEILIDYLNGNNPIPAVEKRVVEISGTNAQAPQNSKIYTIVSGDTLISIAQKQLGTNDWKRVYQENKSVIGENPNLIIVGQKINLTKAA
ncbi:MAG: LysM peptidoglycan-binding domain-containing protein, partial [Oscillospiraceae bacterium]